jgi:glycosyltransferase involved in cell wall biosynthesis
MKVAVIIPCYNVEALLPRALDSVLAQDHTDLDILCVDDGSTDGTVRVVEHYAGRSNGRVRLHRQTNQGAGAARNAGLARTEGEWVQFLDADDVIGPSKIGHQLKLIAEAASPPDLVAGDYETAMPDGLLIQVRSAYGQPWMGLVRTRLGCTCSNLWRRHAVAAAGGWPENLGSSQDYTLLFHMLRNGCTVIWDPDIRTVIHKREAGSISQTGYRANWQRYITLRRTIRDHLAATDPVRHRAEIAAADQHIFMALRILAQYDVKEAIGLYRSALPSGFVPEESRAISDRYLRFYRWLGFAGAERLVHLMRKGAPA